MSTVGFIEQVKGPYFVPEFFLFKKGQCDFQIYRPLPDCQGYSLELKSYNDEI